MPRTARIDLPEFWYHITIRGQRRERVFLCPEDYQTFLGMVERDFEKHNLLLGAYCLMPNHGHLVVYRHQTSLGDVFRGLNMKYANYFNKKYQKSGYVFQGRFHSVIVLNDEYLLTLLKYLHENPLLAALVEKIEEYPYSSDSFYRAGNDANLGCLVPIPGFENDDCREKYLALLQSDRSISDLPIEEHYIGTPDEIARIERRRTQKKKAAEGKERRLVVPLRERMEKLLVQENVTLEQIQAKSRRKKIAGKRDRIMATLYQEGYSPAEIGRLCRRTPSAVLYAAGKNENSY